VVATPEVLVVFAVMTVVEIIPFFVAVVDHMIWKTTVLVEPKLCLPPAKLMETVLLLVFLEAEKLVENHGQVQILGPFSLCLLPE
jgi:cytochrome c oxidase subunit IV